MSVVGLVSEVWFYFNASVCRCHAAAGCCSLSACFICALSTSLSASHTHAQVQVRSGEDEQAEGSEINAVSLCGGLPSCCRENCAIGLKPSLSDILHWLNPSLYHSCNNFASPAIHASQSRDQGGAAEAQDRHERPQHQAQECQQVLSQGARLTVRHLCERLLM